MDAVEFDIRIDYYKGSPETSGNYAGPATTSLRLSPS
jgi:hypothetical protein